MPGPRGLPVIGTLWDYLKKDGYTFSKMFKVNTNNVSSLTLSGAAVSEKVAKDAEERMNVAIMRRQICRFRHLK